MPSILEQGQEKAGALAATVTTDGERVDGQVTAAARGHGWWLQAWAKVTASRRAKPTASAGVEFQARWLVPQAEFPLPLRIEFLDETGQSARLLAPFRFVDRRDGEVVLRVDVPTGFETDFNSVPRGLWNVFPPWRYPHAAIVHDFMYRDPRFTDRRQADAAHRRILELLGCPREVRWAVHLMLRAWGWRPWAASRIVAAL